MKEALHAAIGVEFILLNDPAIVTIANMVSSISETLFFDKVKYNRKIIEIVILHGFQGTAD